MGSVICTLFEGDYHFGVGALANSLYAHGFRGTIYAGYRGSLPPWVIHARKFDGFIEFCPAEQLALRFIQLETQMHLTNYKPNFMLALWEKYCQEANALFYFDPDIVIKCRWTFFEEWVHAGVALCADINPSMPPNHPIRYAWKKFATRKGMPIKREVNTYYNGGFVGCLSESKQFVCDWKRILEMIADELGGLKTMHVGDGTSLFHTTEQDALNLTCMVTPCELSPVGQDGMDFQQGGGGYIMAHAVGSAKPWNKAFLRMLLLRGSRPSRADKDYFKHVKVPIQLYATADLGLRTLKLNLAGALGRFIRAA